MVADDSQGAASEEVAAVAEVEGTVCPPIIADRSSSPSTVVAEDASGEGAEPEEVAAADEVEGAVCPRIMAEVTAEVGEEVWRALEVAAGVGEGVVRTVVFPIEEEEDTVDEADPIWWRMLMSGSVPVCEGRGAVVGTLLAFSIGEAGGKARKNGWGETWMTDKRLVGQR